MKKLLFLLMLIFKLQFQIFALSALDSTSQNQVNVEINEKIDESEVKSYKADTAPILFIILSIFIGVATRHFLKKSPIPFTVLLLIIGLVLGLINRLGYFSDYSLIDLSNIGASINFAAHIDPHMLLFIFLPI